MKKAVTIIILLLVLCPLFSVAAQAAYFTPDVEEDRLLYLFEYPRFNTRFHSGREGWGISPTEQVKVVELKDNGWCEVRYISPRTGEEIEGYILMRMLVPVPGDEAAAELRAAFDNRVERENEVIKWGLIILAIGLVVSFMSFLGFVRPILMAASLIALSVVQIRFFMEAEAFNFVLPSVFGWRVAAIGFGCFLVFFIIQMYLFVRTFSLIEVGTIMIVQGMNMILIICIIMFYALMLLAGIIASAGGWISLMVPFAWVDENFMLVFAGVQAIMLIFMVIGSESKWKAIFFCVPLYIISFSAIIMVLMSMHTVLFFAGIIIALGMGAIGGAMGGGTGSSSDGEETWQQKRGKWLDFRRNQNAHKHGYDNRNKDL